MKVTNIADGFFLLGFN